MPLKAVNWPQPRVVVNVGGYTQTIGGGIPPKIAAVSDVFVSVGNVVNIVFATTQGTPPITWYATGLPAGLFMSNGGVLTGVPQSTGDYPVTIEARGPNSVGSDYKTFTIHISAAKTIYWGNFPGPITIPFVANQITSLGFTRITASRFGSYEFPANSGQYQVIAWPSSYSIAGTVNLRLGNGAPLITQPVNNQPYQINLTIGSDTYSVYVSAWTHAGGLLIQSNTQLVVE